MMIRHHIAKNIICCSIANETVEGFDEDKIAFFSKRFQHLYKKKRSPRRNNGAKGSSSRENKDEPKGLFKLREALSLCS